MHSAHQPALVQGKYPTQKKEKKRNQEETDHQKAREKKEKKFRTLPLRARLLLPTASPASSSRGDQIGIMSGLFFETRSDRHHLQPLLLLSSFFGRLHRIISGLFFFFWYKLLGHHLQRSSSPSTAAMVSLFKFFFSFFCCELCLQMKCEFLMSIFCCLRLSLLRSPSLDLSYVNFLPANEI